MKILKSIALSAALIVAFLSCQKEISFETGGKSIGEFLKDAGGDCAPAAVNGIFKQDTVLALDANFVDVQVNVTTPGTFDIKSDTVNGYSFSKTGSVAFGNNTIRLYASGKPIVAGTNTFTITYGASTCTFDITVTGSGVLPAEFTLGSIAGICMQAIPGGTYAVGVPLTASNTLTVQVNVTKAGNYILGAIAPTAGLLFSGSGTFTTLGLQTVTLTGTGTPTTAGIAIVTVTNLASTCTYGITVQAAAPPAVFTLDGAPNGCTNFILNGTYAAGVAASVSNTVTLNVNVTTAGSYTITTNTANGITFSKTGVFTATGLQTVVLTATGTPTAAGAFTFTPVVTTGNCNFSVTCTGTPPLPTGDYFPLTANSWWSYDEASLTDTIYHVVIGIKPYNGNNYTDVQANYAGTPSDTLHYRKNGNNYFNWCPTDTYSAQFGFDNEQFVDINFLKENTATATMWSSAEYTGTTGGIGAKLRYDFKIENANTSITVNGKNYTSVIHVSATVQVNIAPLPYTAFEKNDLYFAKGIGLVKVIYNDLIAGGVIGEVNIRNYKVF
jgi:hypothetical protein